MTKVKICGLRRAQDITAINRLHPEYIGFVFAPGKRQVTQEQAASLRGMLTPGIFAVGVFVNPAEEDVILLCREKIIDIIQLHGDEDDKMIARLKEQTGVPVIKSVSVGKHLPPLPAMADFLLFDTAGPARGGTGKSFDWNLLASIQNQPYFLAGGLNADNVGFALEQLTPYAVDVSSGVETDGLKDAGKIEAFIQRVRTAKPQLKKGEQNA